MSKARVKNDLKKNAAKRSNREWKSKEEPHRH